MANLDKMASASARSRDPRRRVQAGKAKDELGWLAATFNEMLGLLGVRLDALGQARSLARGQELIVDEFVRALVEGAPDRLEQLLMIRLDDCKLDAC